MTEPEFVNSLHVNQRKAYWQLKAKAQEDLRAKLDLAVEALLPLAKIAKVWEDDGLDESRPVSWKDTREHASKVDAMFGRGGKTLLTLGDAFKAQDFFKKLGIEI
jgi:hypothetical protein